MIQEIRYSAWPNENQVSVEHRQIEAIDGTIEAGKSFSDTIEERGRVQEDYRNKRFNIELHKRIDGVENNIDKVHNKENKRIDRLERYRDKDKNEISKLLDKNKELALKLQKEKAKRKKLEDKVRSIEKALAGVAWHVGIPVLWDSPKEIYKGVKKSIYTSKCKTKNKQIGVLSYIDGSYREVKSDE